MNEVLTFIQTAWTACPNWLQAVIVLLIGLAAAFFGRFLVSTFLKIIRFDRLNEKIGISDFLRKGGVVYTASRLIGVMVFWMALITAFLEASRLLDIKLISSVFAKFTTMLPGIIAAILVTIVGLVVIGFLGNFATTIARNAGFNHARLLGKAIRYLGFILVGIMALEQVEVGAGIFGTVLLILFAALALALALAFGLGCKDMAKDAAQKALRVLRENSRSGSNSDLEG